MNSGVWALLTFSAAELRAYGPPLVPEDSHHRARYRQVFNHIRRKLTFVEPEFQANRDRIHGPRWPAINPATQTSSGWSGGVVSLPLGQSFRWVQGEFVAPNVEAPSDGSFNCSVWIGIDGDPGIQVFQAGVECDVLRSGSDVQTDFYAWATWDPHPAI